MGGYRNTSEEQQKIYHMDRTKELNRGVTNLVWRFVHSPGEEYFGGMFLHDASRAL